MECEDLTREFVRESLAGDADAQRILIETLTPEIQHSVYRMLLRWRMGPAAGRDARQEVEDMVQEVWVELYKHEGRVLRRWDPARRNLCAFVVFIAKIRTAGTLRSRLSQWREDPREITSLDSEDPAGDPERIVFNTRLMEAILVCLYDKFTPADAELFELLFLHELSVEEAAEKTGKSKDAIYKWRSRLYKRAKDCLDRLSK